MAALTASMNRPGATTGGPGGPPAARTTGPAGGDRSTAVSSGTRTVRSWPLLVLAAPAAAEVFSRGRPLEKMSGPHVCPAQRLVMVKLPDVTGVVQGHRRRVVAAWLSGVMGSRLAARARLGSRSWTFDWLNTLTCGFTSQVDGICALTRVNSWWMGSPGCELESPVPGYSRMGEQDVTRPRSPARRSRWSR